MSGLRDRLDGGTTIRPNAAPAPNGMPNGNGAAYRPSATVPPPMSAMRENQQDLQELRLRVYRILMNRLDLAKLEKIDPMIMQADVSSVNFGLNLKPIAVKKSMDRGRSFTGRFRKILVAMSRPA